MEKKAAYQKFRNAAFRPFRIIEFETLENKYHCNSSDFFSLSPLFYFPVPRFIWHAIRDRQRVHLVSMKSKSIFSQITHASRLRRVLRQHARISFLSLLRPTHTPSSLPLLHFLPFYYSFIHSFISQFVSFEILWRNRVVNSSRGWNWFNQ